MANQQPPYHNSGYYAPYMYQNGYPQQYAQPPPHYGLNGHPPSHTPPRMSAGPSNGVGRGSYSNRGHQPYHPHLPIYNQHFQHVDGATPSPPPISPTYAHPHPHKSQSTHAPYPHYPIPPPNAYHLSWPTEPLSPLPKQLSGLNHFPPNVTATPQPGPSTYDVPPVSEPVPELTPVPAPEPAREPALEPVSEPASESAPEPVSEPISQSPSVPFEPSSEQTSPIITSPLVTKRSAASSVEKSKNEFAIWSRRPTDPSVAPAIIISPRARPPPQVIDDALKLPTPPLTPVQAAVNVPEDPDRDKSTEAFDEPPTAQTQIADSPSPVTETTTATPSVHDITTPASPISSRTSISNASPADVKSPSTPSTAVLVDIPAAAESPKDKTEVEITPPAPPTPATPPVKKSWASLLKKDDVTSTGKNALPTSTVVGYSVPGGSIDNSQATPIAMTKKQELATLLTAGPSGPGQVPKIRPRGLVNSGNMCFANAVLQALVYCPPFYRLFTELAKYLPGPSSDSRKSIDNRISLTTGTIEFLREFNPLSERERRRREEDGEDGFLDSFTPVSVYDAMRAKKRFDNMRGGHQEDAEEFLGFYLDTLEDEFLSLLASVSPKSDPQNLNHTEEREEVVPKEDGWMEVGRRNRMVVTRTAKATDSPITRIFGGTFRSTLRVPQHKDSVVVESWRALQLDIQREQVNTIGEALQCISNPQPVTVTSPTRPGVSVDAHQQVLIESLPPILVLHLKRFLYDTEVGDVVKIGKPISFTPELEIDSNLISPGRRQAQKVKYKLFGVLYHHGLSASGGHYTLDVLHPNRDMTQKSREAWIRIDDELVSDVLPKDVFEADRDHRCPYLLFYKRVAHAWSK